MNADSIHQSNWADDLSSVLCAEKDP